MSEEEFWDEAVLRYLTALVESKQLMMDYDIATRAAKIARELVMERRRWYASRPLFVRKEDV